MSLAYEGEQVTLHLGDCVEVMRALPECSVDAIVTDPPYDLTSGKKGGTGEASVNLDSPYGRSRITTGGGGFMGKAWDSTGIAFDVETWRLVYRLLKPGGHVAAFGGTRTYHRMAVAIEDAGFEIRDSLIWMYGSGFPKSLNVSKAIDRANGDERERVPATGGLHSNVNLNDDGWKNIGSDAAMQDSAIPASAASAAWDGWGTALKPAYEPIVLARKPLVGTVAQNVTTHGTGALNIDGCRIGTEGGTAGAGAVVFADGLNGTFGKVVAGLGRWPANVLLDEEAAALLDAQTGESESRIGMPRGAASGDGWGMTATGAEYADRGGASRFFYTAKSSRREREAGVDVEPARRADADSRQVDAPGSNNPRLRVNARRNDHPTVKPVDLMRWLCRLVTPAGGTILDPFLGSGTTAMAALDEGFRSIGIEREARYLAIAQQRITHRHLLEVRTVEPTAASPNGRLL